MAKDVKPTDKGKAAAKSKGGSDKGFIVAMILIAPLGGGGGFLFASQFVKPQKEPAAAAAPKVGEADKHEDAHGGHGAGAKAEAGKAAPTGDLIALPPIVTNLAPPGNPYIRLESSIVVEPGYADGKILAAKVSEDIIALLRTVPLVQLEGAAGLNHLREDMLDRVKVRSENKASDFIIHTLVIE